MNTTKLYAQIGLVLIGLIFGVLASIAHSSAVADTVTYHGTFSFSENSANSAQIASGDVFYYEFSLNDSVVDGNNSPQYAYFPSLITSFNLVAAAGNVGTWNPTASGSWTTPTDAYADFGQMRYIINGSGFQSLDYQSMFENGTSTSISMNPTFNSTLLYDIGGGQTFAQIIGTFYNNPFFLPSSVIPYFFVSGEDMILSSSLSFGSGSHPMLIPEASSGMLLMGSVVVGLLRRRKKG